MRQNRKIATAVALVGAIALGTALTVFFTTRPKPVLQIARDFCIVKPWGGQQLFPHSNHHYWLSNSEALVVLDIHNIGDYDAYRVAAGPDGRARFLDARPVKSGAAGNMAVSPNG